MLQHNKIEENYKELVKVKAVKEDSIIQSHLKWQKAVNDLLLAEKLLQISTNKKLKEVLSLGEDNTFFDWVVVCSYFSIFHATQALLGLKKIKIINRLHHATLTSFAKHFIINDELAEELFFIYEDAETKAKDLLDILEEEKGKRGLFQYHRLSRHNLDPAKDSVENAKKFLATVQEVLKKNKVI